jgi:hypothetical protein
MPASRTLITTNETQGGPGAYVTENKIKNQTNPRDKTKYAFLKGQRKETVVQGPSPADYFVDGRFGQAQYDPNTAFSRVPRKTYLDNLPKDNNMSAFYKEKGGLVYKPKKINGYNFPTAKREDC